MRKILLLAVGAATLGLPAGAVADAVYHSQHIALHSVAGAPLHSGSSRTST
jgi:hypothetical protein